MQRTYQITGLVLLLLAAFLGYSASELDYFSEMGPGAGFFPVWLCGLLALLSVMMILQATFRPAEPMPHDFFADGPGYLRILAAVVGLLAVAVLMETIGYSLVTFAFFVCLLFVFGRRNPVEILVLSALGSFGVFYLFTRLLGQPLPMGPFLW